MNFLDTSEMLTEQDYADMKDIKDIKRQVMSYINFPILIEYITELIEKSPFLAFKNDRAKKFIDNKRPIFYIKIDREQIAHSKKYDERTKFSSQEEEIKFFSNVIFMEVITYITSFITTSLKQNPYLENYIAEKDIFKDINKENRRIIADQTAILSTMFGIRFSQEDPTVITLEMLL